MRIRLIILIVFYFLSINFLAAQSTYDFNANSKEAYEAIIALNFKQGQELINKEKRENPDNLIPYFLENYMDVLPILFNGEQQLFSERKSALQERIDLLKKGDSNSPWHLYTQAAVYFQWAAAYIRMNERTRGALHFRRFHNLAKKNQETFPGFTPNEVLLGVEEALIGTLPSTYQWLANVLGFKGDLKNGISTVKKIALKNQNTIFQEEAFYFYCYLDFYLGKNREYVWMQVKKRNKDLPHNHLFTYIVANMALDDQKADDAIRVLQARKKDTNYMPLHFFDYQLSLAYIHKIDSRAVSNMERFMRNYKGDVFLKNAYQKLSLYYYAIGANEKARSLKNSISKIGSNLIDADKQANRFAEQTSFPNRNLIRVRLKNEGGFTMDALNEISQINPNSLKKEEELLEYYFRFAHIYEQLENNQAALLFYERCIKAGKNSKEQFPARSALHIAEIYENAKKYSLAKKYYELCLSMKNHDFQSNIDQKAKSGLHRLSNY